MRAFLFLTCLAASIAVAGGCSRERSFDYEGDDATSTIALDGKWDCASIVGPVNNGPGVCPDCVSELCVEMTASNLLTFALQVREPLEDPTELCALPSVLVKQGTTTLYEGSLPVVPIELEPGFEEIAAKPPLVTANVSLGASIFVSGAFGRPDCD